MSTPPPPPSYPSHPRSTIHRYRANAVYDYTAIHDIINTSTILHVSFLPLPSSTDPFPTTLPMIGHMGSFTNPSADATSEPLDLYIHASSASRLMRLGKDGGNGDAGPDHGADEEAAGLPVCVAATILDGIVLALTPYNHNCNYRSAVLHGYGTIVRDDEEKLYAMRLITDGLIPNRWRTSRTPPSKTELTATSIMKIRVASASAKVRVGGPSEDRKDLKDPETVGKVWTGVVPVWERMGEPVPGEKNRVEGVPGWVGEWRAERNRGAEGYAGEVAGMAYK